MALMVLALETGRRAQPSSQGVNGSGRSATSDIRPLVQTTFDELNGEISPDSRWVAYQSNESGQARSTCGRFRTPTAAAGGVHARRDAAAVGTQWQGTLLPGTEWRGDERSVEGGSTFRPGNPTRLFEGPYL